MLVAQKRDAAGVGVEFEEPIREYWRTRQADCEQKERFKWLETQGYGRDPTLDDDGRVPFPGTAPAWQN